MPKAFIFKKKISSQITASFKTLNKSCSLIDATYFVPFLSGVHNVQCCDKDYVILQIGSHDVFK